jgi:hypothetical protein
VNPFFQIERRGFFLFDRVRHISKLEGKLPRQRREVGTEVRKKLHKPLPIKE